LLTPLKDPMMTAEFPPPANLTPAARYGLAEAPAVVLEQHPELRAHLLITGLFVLGEGGKLTPTSLLLGVSPERFTAARQNPPAGHGIDFTYEHQRLHRELGGIRLTTYKCVGCAELFPCQASLDAQHAD
jgi:hypothetical protein